MISVQPKHQFTYDGATVLIYHANKGEGLLMHTHAYSHATFCAAGSFILRKENKEVVFTKDTQPANLVAAEPHEIEALEDGTVFINVFAESKY